MNAQKDKHLYNPPIQSTAGIPGAPIILIPLFCGRMKSFMAESPKSAVVLEQAMNNRFEAVASCGEVIA